MRPLETAEAHPGEGRRRGTDRPPPVALALVAGAFLMAVVGAATATMRSTPSRSPFLIASMVAALAFVVAADRVDAGGEERAAQLTAEAVGENSCDYTPQVYSATPGWFSW